MKKGFLLAYTAIIVTIVFSAAFAPVVNAELPEGISREETVIASFTSVMADPYNFNPIVPGHLRNQGWHQCALDVLWEINVSYGKYINELARAPPEPLNENYTKWRIYLREGVYWSDGVEFTSEDVVFTLKLLASTPGNIVYSFWNSTLKDVVAVDRYTVDLELKRPFAKIQNYLGCQAYTVNTVPLPEHIWKGQDPLKFKFYPPVGTGPYVLKDVDPNGYWALWEKRSDWERSSVGRQGWDLSKAPKYILYINYGTKEKFLLEMINHNLDIMFQFSPEEWDTLREQNPNATAWYGRDFPWGCYDDGCIRDLAFNLEKYPFNITDVRWALALSVNIVEFTTSWYRGLSRISPVPMLTYGRHMELYHLPLREWLTNEFTLPDGYKPFDPDVPLKIARAVKEQGYNVPTEDLEKAMDLFGIGWWKYDPEKAAELLEKHGFKRDGDGKWHLPSGELWSFTIYSEKGAVPETREAIALASQWNKFGIDAKVQEVESAVLGPAHGNGNFETSVGSFPCNSPLDDPWGLLDYFNQKYYKPIGTYATSNIIRYKNPEIQTIIDELESKPPIDPSLPSIGLEGFKMVIKDLAILAIGGQIRIMPYDTTYWVGWPTAKDPYNNAACHRSAATYIFINLKPASEAVAPPSVVVETIEEMQQRIGNLTGKVDNLSVSISELQTSVAAQISMINSVLILAVIDFIVAIIAVLLVIRRTAK